MNARFRRLAAGRLFTAIRSIRTIITVIIFALIYFTSVILDVSERNQTFFLERQVLEMANELQSAKIDMQAYRTEKERIMRLFGLVPKVDDSKFNKANVSAVQAANSSEIGLVLPSIFKIFPNLLDSNSVKPAVLISKRRSSVSVVIGIPTVRRSVKSYLNQTIEGIIDNMSPEDLRDSMIVLFVAETNGTYVGQIVQEVRSRFDEHIESGFLEIISPDPSFYPDFSYLKKTLGDPMDRVKWRSKQNLDYSYLMMYAQSRGEYFLLLEDDVTSSENFLKEIKDFARKQTVTNSDWIILDFTGYGIIGSLYRSETLSNLVYFILIFYNDMPIDWIIVHYIKSKIENFDKSDGVNKAAMRRLKASYSRSLFKHIGHYSSLKGKFQKVENDESQ
ncbi:MGAT4B (predicted) [Pycnogonum litorale]